MADKEKVRRAIGFCRTPDCRSDCPYKDNGIWCVYSLLYDAHAVIEEQEARIAELEQLVRRIDIEDTDRWGGRGCD